MGLAILICEKFHILEIIAHFSERDPCQIANSPASPPPLEKSVNIVWHHGTQPIQRSIWKNTILASSVYKLTTLFTAKGNFG